MIDGAFVGNTPSNVPVTNGNHEITVQKKGFADWTRKLSVSGGSIHLSADLDPRRRPLLSPHLRLQSTPATTAPATAPQ